MFAFLVHDTKCRQQWFCGGAVRAAYGFGGALRLAVYGLPWRPGVEDDHVDGPVPQLALQTGQQGQAAALLVFYRPG